MTYGLNCDTGVLCLPALTPLGSTAISYSDPVEWNRFQPTSCLEATSLTSPTGVMKHLFMNTYSFNVIASSWYQKAKRGDLALLRQMLCRGPVVRVGNNVVHHGVVQMRLLNQLVQAMESVTRDSDQIISKSIVCSRVVDLREAAGLPKLLISRIQSCQNWPDMVRSFMESWILEEQTKDDTEMVELTNVGEGDHGVAIMQSLGCQAGRSANASYLKHVESNFAAAALGLHALAQVSYCRDARRSTELLIHFRGHAGLRRISSVDARVLLEIRGSRIPGRWIPTKKQRPLAKSRSESL